MNQTTRGTATSAVGVLVLAIATTLEFGLTGLLAAALTAVATTALGPVYGFALGQLAIAVLVPETASGVAATPALLVAQVGLFVVLWSALASERPGVREALQTGAVAVLGTIGFGVLAWGVLAQTEALWLTGGVLLASIVVIGYCLHRYTIVFVRDPISHE